MSADTALNLQEQQAKNRRQTMAWMAVFVLFFAWLGFGGDLAAYFLTMDAQGVSHHTVWWGGFVVTGIGALVTWRAFTNGPKRVLQVNGARLVEEPATPQERQLVNVVEEMAIAAGLPKPRVYMVDDPDPNAFATGHGPEDSAIAVTSGLLEKVNREELQAVVGHEMGHVRNLDVRLMTTVAALVGFVVLASEGMRRFLGWGGDGGLFRRGRGKGGGATAAIGLVILVLWIITLILAPLIMRLMAMAVSRNREYLADATGAELTRNPGALASALQKIDAAVEPTKSINKSAAHLCITDPLGRAVNNKEGRLANLFGTHPPMVMRITRLKGMAFQQAKAAGNAPPA